MAIIKTEDLTPQGRAARNRAIKRLIAAKANAAEVRARNAGKPYQQGGPVDRENMAAFNELNNAMAAFSPQFGKYELPEELTEASMAEGLI